MDNRGRAYVGPAHEVAAPILKILERWVFDYLVWKIDVQRVFEQGEASVNRAVVPSKFLIRAKVEDHALYPVVGLLSDCVDVVGTGLVEPSLTVWLGIFVQTGSESGRGRFINMRSEMRDANHRLSANLSKLRAIIPCWILDDVEVNHARAESIHTILHVADLINNEQGVDKVTADSETLERSKGVGVGDQELVAACDELRSLLIAEDFEAVDPSTGLGCRGFVVGVGCILQRTHGMEIGKGKLLHDRRGVT